VDVHIRATLAASYINAMSNQQNTNKNIKCAGLVLALCFAVDRGFVPMTPCARSASSAGLFPIGVAVHGARSSGTTGRLSSTRWHG
jgi:hypothetical protein